MELIKTEPGEIQLISISRIESMITGAKYFTYNSKKELAAIFYEDDTKENCIIPVKKWIEIKSVFELTTIIQSNRTPGGIKK